VAALLREAERPVVMAGTGLYWGQGEDGLRALAEELRIPVFLNGLARGCLPADHELYFSRARGDALRGADLALVIGVPLDFRLGFGAAFAGDADVVIIDVAEPQREHPRPVAAELYGALPATLDGLRVVAAGGSGVLRERERWVDSLRSVEQEKRAAEAAELSDERAPLHPMRVYGELARVLDRDAIVVGDGGDFVSYAGRLVEPSRPGCWLDPGPFGCLGTGLGYTIGARTARPDAQVVLLLGDGAAGFSLMDVDTLVRHRMPAVIVVGNNGIWGLEKHPMQAVYGYDVAAELQPGLHYDQVVTALGGGGETVTDVTDLQPALERAFTESRNASLPYCVNVMLDPAVAYPRSANLA
jgi:acetolactate synthase-1/2/3 large subunit